MNLRAPFSILLLALAGCATTPAERIAKNHAAYAAWPPDVQARVKAGEVAPGFTPAQIQVVGNTSLGGAFLALNDRSLLAEMSSACTRLESVELNLQPGFEDAYIDQLMLP